MSPVISRRRARALTLVTSTIAACCLSSLQAAALQKAPPVAPRQTSHVIDALLAGKDARPAIALTKADSTSSRKEAVLHDQTAFAGYAGALDAVRQDLAGLRRTGKADLAAITATVERAQAQQLLVDARMEQVGNQLDARALPASARTRWAEHRNDVAAATKAIDGDLRALQQRLQHGAGQIGTSELDQWSERLAAGAASLRVFGANPLPVHRPRLAPRAPRTSPVIVPGYLDRTNDPTFVALDRAASSDAPLSAALVQQASQLGNEPARIFDFVRSTVRSQWYAGAQKGAERTLATQAGNDVDQASLLIALLRASNIAARYVRGVVEVPVEDLSRMLGVRLDKVGSALTAAGVANEPVMVGVRVGAYRIEHVFVSAYIPLSAYRGTATERSGYTWVPLMPALKPHAFVPAAGVLGAGAIDVRGFVDTYLTAPNDALPRSVLEARVGTYLATLSPRPTLESQLSVHEVEALPLELLPASTPFSVVAVTGEFATLPAELRQFAHLRVRAENNDTATPLIEREVPISELLDRRVTLSYEPASIDDGAIADSFGGMGSTPLYLLHVRPVLNVAGQPLVHGSGEVEGGHGLRLEISFSGPAGETGYAQEVLAGGYEAIAIDVQGEAPATQASSDLLVGDSEPPAARLLANFGARYLGTWDDEDRELARLVGVSVIRPFPSAVLVTNQYRVDRVGSTVERLAWQGVALDAGLRPAEALAQTNAMSSETDWTMLSALQGSALEHRLFEQQWSVESISADKGIGLARASGVPLLWIAPGGSTADLNQSPEIIAAIRSWLDRGYAVEVPRDPLTLNAWHGAVWRALNNASGESGYFIAGGLAGGATTPPPSDWYFTDLAQLLASPYASTPNTDANAVVAITLDESTQQQRGVAGKELDKPLRAVVRDVVGRPVKGANVVFAVSSGNGKLLDAQGGEVNTLTAVSNNQGIAEAHLKLGKTQASFGSYVLDADMEYPQRVGLNRIEVSVPTNHGDLLSGRPFFADTWPDKPNKIIFVQSEDGLVPGAGFVALMTSVYDEYNNEISNAVVNADVSTTYEPIDDATCIDGSTVARIDAGLFIAPMCPEGQLLLTETNCARSTVSLKSRPMGARINVVPPNATSATVKVHGTVGGTAVEETYTRHTDDDAILLVACGGLPNITKGFLWNTVSSGPLSTEQPDAARLNELLPGPRRIDIVKGIVTRSQPPSVVWEPVSDATIEFNLQHGSVENLHLSAAGIYQFDLRAGSAPGKIHGEVAVRLPNEMPQRTQHEGIGWAVDPRSPLVEPNPIALTPFNATESTFRITANFQPSDYKAWPLALQVLDGDNIISEASTASGNSAMFAEVQRGFVVEPTHHYVARAILNEGTPFRMESAKTDLTFGLGVIGGFGVVFNPDDAPLTALQIADLVSGQSPQLLRVSATVDMANQFGCFTGDQLAYLLIQNSKVTLKFFALDQSGAPANLATWQPLDAEPMTAGVHTIDIDFSHLHVGEYKFELSVQAPDGKTETRVGRASSTFKRIDALPLAHTLIKGVDVHSGSASISESDIDLGGRGPGLHLARTYNSHQGNQSGVLGDGWSTNLDAKVTVTACGQRIVTGSVGQGMAFAPDHITADGAQVYKALHGYHATLVERHGFYDLYGKDGTHQRFDQPSLSGMRLTSVNDPNGNAVVYTWDVQDSVPRVTQVRDAAGRQIDLGYAYVNVVHTYGEYSLLDSSLRLTSAKGPLGLLLVYTYNSDGNLERVTRLDGTGGDRVQEYTYRDYGSAAYTTPSGDLQYERFGFRLKSARNAINGDTRTYEYVLGWNAVERPDGVMYQPEQRVSKVTEPDQGETTFLYTGPGNELRGLGPSITEVTDHLHRTTHYGLNRYGAAESVTHPTIEAGTAVETTEWDFVHFQPHKITDALGTITTYTYDDAGNKASETIAHPSRTLTRSWTYKPASDFDPPYIRNAMATAVDGRHILTTFEYDSHGNRTDTKRGGVTERDGYATNGDHTSHTDGARKVWLYRYDDYGTLKEAEDPLHNVRRSEFDARGRQISETDANGAKTTTTYDALDRVRVVTYPATEAGAAVETTVYDDQQRMTTHTDALQRETVTVTDWAGRAVWEHKYDGTRTHTYDKVGNLKRETDFAGHPTTYVYDDDNHRVTKDEPEGRRTEYKPDLMGHVLSETVSDRGDAAAPTRVTQYVYDHPLYARTAVKRLLRGTNSDRTLEETSVVDDNGNVTRSEDALGRVTDFTYDNRDRLHIEAGPLGRTIATDYDDADRKVREARANPAGSGEQVRQWVYDDAGRLIDTIDANDAHHKQGYDPAGNVTSRTDALSHPTSYTYDARHHVRTETGPEAGQITTYHYDLQGNRIGEDWPNGRHLVTTYDELHRPKERSDDLGVVEKLTYLADNEVFTRTDAVGAVTTQFYDGLHRPYRTELPKVDGVERIALRHYSVHGDVLDETDPGNHITSYTYDSLGRRTSTTLPAVDGQSDTLTTTYDDVGNVLTQTDARHATTTYVVNALNQRTNQIDPADGEGHGYNQIWTYDQVGNVISHTDRRSILTLTSYDKENRPTGVMRDALLLSRTEYDAQGNVKRQFDALNDRTDLVYDKANRKLREDRSLSAASCGNDGCAPNEGATRRWTYTPLGDIASETDADARTTQHEYTLRRFALSDTNAAHETTTYTVDGEGRRLTIQRPGADDSTRWVMGYDDAGQLRTVTDPLHHTTIYGYDVDGRRTTIQDARHNTTTFGYDARHRLRSKTYPTTTTGAAVHTWHYDANNNLDQEVTPNGRRLSSTYDALNRRTDLAISAQSGAPEEAATHWRYDGNGNVLTIEETRGAETLTDTRQYDHFDRLEHRVNTDGSALTYGYDDVGNRTRLIDADGTTTWTYDALNRNTGVAVTGQGTTLLDYYPSGLPKTTTRPDGSTSTTTYDDAGRVESIVHAKAGNAIATLHYTYYPGGNRHEQKESNGAVTQNAEQLTTYVYDTADRLTEITEPAASGAGSRHTTYILDEVGNRTDEAITLDGTPVSHSTLQYNDRDQLTHRDDPIANVHVVQTFDADGNLATQTSNGLQRVSTYDARDRLVTLAMPNAPPNALLTFIYDSTGLRTRKVQQGGAETRYRYDGQSLLAETNALGNTLSRYHYSASALISRTEAGSTPTYRHYLLDALKTPIALLTQDGAVSSRTRTDAWGEVIAQLGTNNNLVTPNREQANAELPSSDNQPVGYTGYLKDSESGLYYAKARYYDPAVARFTTEDPEAGKDLTPPSLHRYLYAYANPTVWVDPTGRDAIYENERLIKPGTEYYEITRDGQTKYYNADANEWSDKTNYAGLQSQVEAFQLKKQTKQESWYSLDRAYRYIFGSDGSKENPERVVVESPQGPMNENDSIVADYKRESRTDEVVGTGRAIAHAGEEGLCSVSVACATSEAISGEDQDHNKLSTGERVVAVLPGGIRILKDGKNLATGGRELRVAEDAIKAEKGAVEGARSENAATKEAKLASVEDRNLKVYPDGSVRTSDGKFASIKGAPAPGTSNSAGYADFLRSNGVDVVGTELEVNGPLGVRRYDIVTRNPDGSLFGIEVKSGGAGSDPYQRFSDMYVNQFGAAGRGRIEGQRIIGTYVVYLPSGGL